MNPGASSRTATGAAFIAVILFAPLFRWGLARPSLFWWWMAGWLALVNGILLAFRPDLRAALTADFSAGLLKKCLLGLGSALALYAVFLAGRVLLSVLLPQAGEHIARVYAVRPALPAWLIAMLMIAVIGPGEELFWRLFLQNELVGRFGPAAGLAAATACYALVHAGSGNPVLVLAAAVAGLFWGWLYIRTRSILAVIVSHTAWDLAIFLVAPL